MCPCVCVPGDGPRGRLIFVCSYCPEPPADLDPPKWINMTCSQCAEDGILIVAPSRTRGRGPRQDGENDTAQATSEVRRGGDIAQGMETCVNPLGDVSTAPQLGRVGEGVGGGEERR